MYSQRTDAESLISTDLEREQNLDKIERRAIDSDSTSIYASGNRSNLLFVETCLEHIDQNLNLDFQDQVQNSVNKLECGILGLQSGHFKAVQACVDHLYHDKRGEDDLKNKLWALFRSASTMIRLLQQIKQSRTKELDEYDTFYSEMFDSEDLNKLA